MRNKYEEQLERLNASIVQMGRAVEIAIESTMLTLMGRDAEAAKSVRLNDDAIDDMERDIESQCMKILLQQQPVAGDLRVITAALKMITDMERIGDHAVDIADLVLQLPEQSLNFEPGSDSDLGPELGPDFRCGKMAELDEMTGEAIRMLHGCIQAFTERNYDKAKNVIAADDTVDALYHSIKKDLIEKIRRTDKGDQIMDYLLIAKYIERIGDHAVNIARWVVFALTGKKE